MLRKLESRHQKECLNTYGVSMQWNAVEPRITMKKHQRKISSIYFGLKKNALTVLTVYHWYITKGEGTYSPICLCMHKIPLEGYTRKLVVKQEMDGPQAEQPEFVPCGQIHPNSRSERGTEPCTDKRQRRVFLILESKETFPTMRAQKGSLEVKKGVMSTTHRSLC